MTDLHFKIVQPEDLDGLVKISIETYSSAFEKQNNPNDFKAYLDTAFSKKTLQAELLNANSIFYYVYLKDNLVGYFKLNENDAQSEPLGRLFIELERIYIIEKFQKQSIGHYIINKVISIARQKQYTTLWLGVWEENKKAIAFYEKQGFSIFDSHSFFMGTDEQTDLLMQLSLS